MEISSLDIHSLVQSALAEGSTQSEMTTMDNCGMLWFWRYGMLLRKRSGFSWATTYGSAVHQALEEMYATQGKRWSVPDLRTFVPKHIILSAAQMKDLEYWQGVLRVQTEAYAHYHRDDFEVFTTEKVELIVDLMHTFEGKEIRLKGMIDLTFCNVANGGRWMMDHKTTSRLDFTTVSGWDFRFQFMFYMWLLMKYEEQHGDKIPYRGYYINAMKKPSIKVRQGDTLEMFFGRLANEMAMEPAKYYYREPLYLNKDSLHHFETEVLNPKLHRILTLTNPETPASIINSIVKNKNTDHCQRYGACEFLPLCAHGFELEGFQYEERESKHEELEAEGGE